MTALQGRSHRNEADARPENAGGQEQCRAWRRESGRRRGFQGAGSQTPERNTSGTGTWYIFTFGYEFFSKLHTV